MLGRIRMTEFLKIFYRDLFFNVWKMKRLLGKFMNIDIDKNIKNITFAFSFLFFVYWALQQYISLYYANLWLNVWFVSLIIIYLFFNISLFFTDKVINKFWLKKSMLYAMFIYITYSLIIFLDNHIIVYLFSGLIWLSAWVLWVSQWTYISSISDDKNSWKNMWFFYSVYSLFSLLWIIIMWVVWWYIWLKYAVYILYPLIFFSLYFIYKLDDIVATNQKLFNNFSFNIFRKKEIFIFLILWFLSYLIYWYSFSGLSLFISESLSYKFVVIFATLFYLIPFLLSYFIWLLIDRFWPFFILSIWLISWLSSLFMLVFLEQSFFIVLWLFWLVLSFSIIRPLLQSLPKKMEIWYNYSLIYSIIWFAQNIWVIIMCLLPLYITFRWIHIFLLLAFIIFIIVLYFLFRSLYSFKE